MDSKQLTLVLVFTCNFFIFNTQKFVTGTLADKPGDGRHGATIIIKDVTQGITVDAFAKYNLAANTENNTPHYSFFRYWPQETVVLGQSVIDIALVPDIQEPNEIMEVGYGIQEEGDITGSLSITHRDEPKKLGMPRLNQAIQRHIRSVQYVQSYAQYNRFLQQVWEGLSFENQRLTGGLAIARATQWMNKGNTSFQGNNTLKLTK